MISLIRKTALLKFFHSLHEIVTERIGSRVSDIVHIHRMLSSQAWPFFIGFFAEGINDFRETGPLHSARGRAALPIRLQWP